MSQVHVSKYVHLYLQSRLFWFGDCEGEYYDHSHYYGRVKRVSAGSATLSFATLPLSSAVPDLSHVIFGFHAVIMSIKSPYEVH